MPPTDPLSAPPTDALSPPEHMPAPARRSCLECVEKHIGAAWALFSEYRNGYPYKVLIVGHLHEAEEESAEWSDLHAIVRESRKQFQQGGRTPDFAVIALKAKEVRDRLSR